MSDQLSELFLARAAEADEAVRETMAALAIEWVATDTTEPLMTVEWFCNALLAGTTGAIADLAWDSCPAGFCVDDIVSIFAASLRKQLEWLATEPPSRKLTTALATVDMTFAKTRGAAPAAPEAPAAQPDDRDELRDALHDLVMLHRHAGAITLPDPSREQWRKAWAAAEELVRVEE